MAPSNDTLIARLRELNTALICDVLDGLGFTESLIGPGIHAIGSAMKLAGTAFTMQCQAIEQPPEKPYQHLIAAFEDIGGGDVLVLATGDRYSAMWGELLSVAARERGATGAVMDGMTRDVDQILTVGFSVFAAGVSPLDSAGRQEVVGHGMPVVCGGATVRPGDLILGDVMGVAVIPIELAEDAIAAAEVKLQGEHTARRDLERGDNIADVFARHGIL